MPASINDISERIAKITRIHEVRHLQGNIFHLGGEGINHEGYKAFVNHVVDPTQNEDVRSLLIKFLIEVEDTNPFVWARIADYIPGLEHLPELAVILKKMGFSFEGLSSGASLIQAPKPSDSEDPSDLLPF